MENELPSFWPAGPLPGNGGVPSGPKGETTYPLPPGIPGAPLWASARAGKTAAMATVTTAPAIPRKPG